MDSTADAESQLRVNNSAFQVGVTGGTQDDSADPPNKRTRLSLSLKKKREPLKEVNRFTSPTKQKQFEKAAEGVVPVNTRCSTNWAIRTFTTWVQERNTRLPEDPVPLADDLLKCDDVETVCKYMRLFVLEARRTDGAPYPPSTICSLLSGINRVRKVTVAFGIYTSF